MNDAALAPSPEATTIQPQETVTTTPETVTAVPTETAPAEPESLLGKDDKAEPEKAPEPELFDPEKVKFPDGVTKDDALFTDFTNLATEHKLTAPVAQAFIDLAAKQVQAAAQRQSAEWATQNENWQAEIKANKEFGGDRLEQNLQIFSKVISDPRFAHPGLRQALAFTGGGNHPAIVETFFKMAKALSEGGAVRGNPAGANRQPETLGQAIYGQSGPHVGGPKFS